MQSFNLTLPHLLLSFSFNCTPEVRELESNPSLDAQGLIPAKIIKAGGIINYSMTWGRLPCAHFKFIFPDGNLPASITERKCFNSSSALVSGNLSACCGV